MKSARIKILYLFVILHLPFLLAAGGEKKYPVSAIPAELKDDADAVIRTQQVIFELKNKKNALKKETYAITVLNKDGLKHTHFVQVYDKFRKIRRIEGRVYDADGNLVRKIKPDDIVDYSANQGGSVFDDSRFKYIDPEYVKYPFTVEYSFDIDYDGLLNLPSWIVYPDFNISVQHSSFEVETPEDLDVKFYEHLLTAKGITKQDAAVNYYSWEAVKLPAITNEPFGPPLQDLSPAVFLAPMAFSLEGFDGSCDSWMTFGQWIKALNDDGQHDLSEETQKEVTEIISNAENDYEKCKLLYSYLQDNTRYVSIQVGIGGWKPMDAEAVDRLGYGDCKALTNYMKVLLEQAGIDAYYTLVYAGDEAPDIKYDFPSNQFNHAILCVPIREDTVWLECTSQRMPFGYLGGFTDDRHVVVINETGGVLTRTRKYDEFENQKNCQITIELDGKGNTTGVIQTDYSGIYYDERYRTLFGDDHDLEHFIGNELHVPNFALQDVSHREKRALVPVIEETISLKTSNYASSMGNRMIFKLNYQNHSDAYRFKDINRSQDIAIKRSVIETDTLVYTLPAGYVVDKVAENRSLETEFGVFNTTAYQKDGELRYTRYLKLNKGTYPASSYAEFQLMVDEIRKADADRVVIKPEELSTVN